MRHAQFAAVPLRDELARRQVADLDGLSAGLPVDWSIANGVAWPSATSRPPGSGTGWHGPYVLLPRLPQFAAGAGVVDDERHPLRVRQDWSVGCVVGRAAIIISRSGPNAICSVPGATGITRSPAGQAIGLHRRERTIVSRGREAAVRQRGEPGQRPGVQGRGFTEAAASSGVVQPHRPGGGADREPGGVGDRDQGVRLARRQPVDLLARRVIPDERDRRTVGWPIHHQPPRPLRQPGANRDALRVRQRRQHRLPGPVGADHRYPPVEQPDRRVPAVRADLDRLRQRAGLGRLVREAEGADRLARPGQVPEHQPVALLVELRRCQSVAVDSDLHVPGGDDQPAVRVLRPGGGGRVPFPTAVPAPRLRGGARRQASEGAMTAARVPCRSSAHGPAVSPARSTRPSSAPVARSRRRAGLRRVVLPLGGERHHPSVAARVERSADRPLADLPHRPSGWPPTPPRNAGRPGSAGRPGGEGRRAAGSEWPPLRSTVPVPASCRARVVGLPQALRLLVQAAAERRRGSAPRPAGPHRHRALPSRVQFGRLHLPGRHRGEEGGHRRPREQGEDDAPPPAPRRAGFRRTH